MNADFTVIPNEYDRAANLEYAGGISTLSHDGIDQFWMGLRAAFPNAEFEINTKSSAMILIYHHVPHCVGHSTGKHEGWGSFGTPTGAGIHPWRQPR